MNDMMNATEQVLSISEKATISVHAEAGIVDGLISLWITRGEMSMNNDDLDGAEVCNSIVEQLKETQRAMMRWLSGE